jgi:ferritin
MFIDHLNCRIGGKVKIGEVPEFTETLISPTHAGEVYVLIEAGTTESIEAILELIIENKSFIDQPFILKMLEEQVEEEDSANRFEVLIRNCKDLVLFNANFDDMFGGD